MHIGRCFLLISSAALATVPALAAPLPVTESASVNAHWNEVERVSDTVPTTQILAHRLTLRSNPHHDAIFRALKNLHTNDTRLQFWFSVINQAVPELEPPTATKTFWNFKYQDELVSDYYNNTAGKHHINFGTIPRWMFKVPPVKLPSDPGASFYAYTDGTSGNLLKDPSGKQFAEYQARIFEWYTKGGFTDELGKYHHSGYHYKIDYWGVLNEPDFENKINVDEYTRIYDAVTTAIHKIDPHVQFFGPEVSGAELTWERYFLNPKNHAPGSLPVKYFVFHNYVNANNDPSTWHAKYFTDPDQGPSNGASAQAFAQRIRDAIKIRNEMSPKTQLVVDELGVFNLVHPGDDSCRAKTVYSEYNPLYWNANGANWAYNFISAERLGVVIMSVSQMDGYPTQCPSISEFDYLTNRPNSHYWVLYLVNKNFGPGNKLVKTNSTNSDLIVQASITKAGRKLLLVNTTDHSIQTDLAGSYSGSHLHASIVDEKSGEQPPREEAVAGNQITLSPFAVAVISQAAN